MLRALYCSLGSMAIGYVIHIIIYWKHNHTMVNFEDQVISAIDLMHVLAVVGIILSFLNIH